MLEVTDICKSFTVKQDGKKRRISPLMFASFSVSRGARIGIMGESGAGKSTLAAIVCGLTKPDSGSVAFSGKELYDAKNRYDRKLGVKIQLLPQQPYLSFDPMQSIGGAVEETLIAAKRAKNKKEARELAKQLFKKVRLDFSLADRLPSQISGGEAQRAVIARALALDPEIIISDESTAMLDPLVQAQILDLYKELSDGGIAVILISHDGALVKSFADKIYELCDGELIERRQYGVQNGTDTEQDI